MKEYLLLFYNQSGKGTYITSPEDMMEDMPKWQQWIGNIAMQGKLVSSQPIEFNGTVITKKGTQEGPFIQEGILLTGYMICKAEDPEEVKEWSKTCPILKYENGSVEIRPIMPFEL
jgi:hypothetical protein